VNFASRELSQKLKEMGLKSISGVSYLACGRKELEWRLFFDVQKPCRCKNNSSPAFSLDDFIGNTEQALKNCEIVWGNYPEVCDHRYKNWKDHRHSYLDSGKDFWVYLEETMKEGK